MQIIWSGRYSYGEPINETHSFKLMVTLIDGVFDGHCIDEEFSKHTNLQPSVKGFIDDGFISFVKQYPCAFEQMENGEFVIDINRRGHEVIYEGNYNEDAGCWEGEWEIEVAESPIINVRSQVTLMYGIWSME